eukprot:CAMPEP_0181204500 /NCGR_PEP_ID=MMETSP1096-20121128/19973_1 /TAXON_ID=156174 ORGANISM="Chrysochromulina ericina, Strain CCMP281" /NCGR_SAMPLE_ID=MMETSP1096 /ASSEMBLY_ACC=CAM_ASM_000453 /LENGTH=322 /DNA_ID=CAMNT_0023295213 /DNA_START=1 /DNA_END=971 /DNA_ORIENTATION=+
MAQRVEVGRNLILAFPPSKPRGYSESPRKAPTQGRKPPTYQTPASAFKPPPEPVEPAVPIAPPHRPAEASVGLAQPASGANQSYASDASAGGKVDTAAGTPIRVLSQEEAAATALLNTALPLPAAFPPHVSPPKSCAREVIAVESPRGFVSNELIDKAIDEYFVDSPRISAQPAPQAPSTAPRSAAKGSPPFNSVAGTAGLTPGQTKARGQVQSALASPVYRPSDVQSHRGVGASRKAPRRRDIAVTNEAAGPSSKPPTQGTGRVEHSSGALSGYLEAEAAQSTLGWDAGLLGCRDAWPLEAQHHAALVAVIAGGIAAARST